MAETR